MKTKNKIALNSIYGSVGLANEDFIRLYSDYIAKEKKEKRIKVIDLLLNVDK
jgi:hypothetical protein